MEEFSNVFLSSLKYFSFSIISIRSLDFMHPVKNVYFNYHLNGYVIFGRIYHCYTESLFTLLNLSSTSSFWSFFVFGYFCFVFGFSDFVSLPPMDDTFGL